MSPSSGTNPAAGLVEAGRRLKEARNKRGWSLQQVAERIHVAVRYLDAIENGDPAGVPAVVYIRGFIINYIRILGLDEEAILRLLDEGGNGSGVILPVSPTSRSAAREKARVTPDWKRNLAIISTVIVAGILLGLAVRGISRMVSGRAGDGVPPSPFETTAPAASVKTPPVHSGDSAKKSAGLRQVVVSVTAIQDCWMQAQVDDGKTAEIELKPGESRVFTASSRVRMFIGNATGVVVSGPQGPIAMPARAGKVVHILITRDSVERLKMPLTPPQSSTVTH